MNGMVSCPVICALLYDSANSYTILISFKHVFKLIYSVEKGYVLTFRLLILNATHTIYLGIYPFT